MSLIADLKPEQGIKGYYLCKYRQILKNKNGKDYCTLRLQDRTGVVDGKIWSIHPGIEDFKVDDIVYVEGDVISYQENLQFNILKIQKAKEGECPLEDLLPHTPKDVKVLEKELFAFIEGISQPKLKALVEGIFYDETIYPLFMKAGAAKSVHHAYLSGLLEHTVNVTKIGTHMASLYDAVNHDLVVAGCLLHDIGKLYELSPFPENDYTDEGQLLGHIMIGVEKINDVAKTIEDFPKEALLILKHSILAHHGEYEFGSPKRPKCIEAMIVHLADNADSKVKMFEEMLQTAQEEEVYLGYHKVLSRNIRKVTL
ncbi:MAG: 3'-5' exoribonuclease YhaM family protein [Cellulosilyticaceae bacterium]